MKISVLGCGRWGSFIAWYLAGLGHSVVSWGPEDAPYLRPFRSALSCGDRRHFHLGAGAARVYGENRSLSRIR